MRLSKGAQMSEAIHRAEHAQRILSDDLVKEALETLKTQTQALFFELPSNAASEREYLHLMDKARQQFENLFKLIVAGGEVSKFELMAEEHTKARVAAIQDRVRQR
jgi:hypothetical protein